MYKYWRWFLFRGSRRILLSPTAMSSTVSSASSRRSSGDIGWGWRRRSPGHLRSATGAATTPQTWSLGLLCLSSQRTGALRVRPIPDLAPDRPHSGFVIVGSSPHPQAPQYSRRPAVLETPLLVQYLPQAIRPIVVDCRGQRYVAAAVRNRAKTARSGHLGSLMMRLAESS